MNQFFAFVKEGHGMRPEDQWIAVLVLVLALAGLFWLFAGGAIRRALRRRRRL